MQAQQTCIDGNEAAARIAYALSEVVAIYPITPASPMGEHADDWASAGRPNRWGLVPEIIEMQSEAGAAGALHGALQKGAMATTFTSSQGLLLMVPNMFKIAGELTPCVIHVAARTIATHALSIFGDHSDVMHARTTGWAMLSAGSVQEAHDFALVSHAATLRSRVPFLHFFDGFRTSHEIDKISVVDDDDLAALVRDDDVFAHRMRGMTPDAPTLRGTAQNPDVFFQSREAANLHYEAVPGIVVDVLDELAARTGRRYGLVDYIGAPDAERVVVLMGSAAGAATEAVETLTARGEKVGVLIVRLYRPFPAAALLDALPATVTSIAVLDRTKEPGSVGEPLYLDVVAALVESNACGTLPFAGGMPRVIGGRYGLSSKEFLPSHVGGVFRELAAERPRPHVTVGIFDDVTRLSVDPDREVRYDRPAGEVQAMFFGLGSDGTVGANKSSVKIIGEQTDLFAQGYFVYDSKKSGSVTISHLRFGPQPIRSTYLIDDADFVACHQFGLLEKMKVVEYAKTGATMLLNSPWPAATVWDHLPAEVQRELIAKDIALYVIDADEVARATGMANRVNTVMQPCFFALSGVLPADDGDRSHQSERRSDVRQARTLDRRAQLRRHRRIARGTAARRDPVSGDVDDDPPQPDPGRRPRVRSPRHCGPAGRRRRSAAGLGPPHRRCLPHRDGQVREALDRIRDPDLRSRCVHRLRTLRGRVPARRDPHEGLRPERTGGCARRVPLQGVPIEGRAGTVDVDPGRAGRLHGMRCVRRRLPGEVEVRGAPQGDQHVARRRAPRRRTRLVGLLPHDPRDRPRRTPPRLGEGFPGAAAAVRVLGCVRRLR